MRNRRRVSMPEAQINLTSLLDITFVLLIAFMVVAPALKYAVELELPNVRNAARSHENKPVTIHVTWSERAGAGYHVNGKQMLLDEVAAAVKSAGGGEEAKVALEADKHAPWQDVAALINELKINNINAIGLVTKKDA
jgi:biopolymer transport protein ExbD